MTPSERGFCAEARMGPFGLAGWGESRLAQASGVVTGRNVGWTCWERRAREIFFGLGRRRPAGGSMRFAEKSREAALKTRLPVWQADPKVQLNRGSRAPRRSPAFRH